MSDTLGGGGVLFQTEVTFVSLSGKISKHLLEDLTNQLSITPNNVHYSSVNLLGIAVDSSKELFCFFLSFQNMLCPIGGRNQNIKVKIKNGEFCFK